MEDDDVSSGSEDEDWVDRSLEDLRLKDSFASKTTVEMVNGNFNFENVILIENLYSRLLKDLQSGLTKFDGTILTWFDFVSLNYDVYSVEYLVQDKLLQRNIKRFFIAELILFSLLYKRDLRFEQIYNAIKTSFFYLHQNYIIIMFLIIQRTPKEVLYNNDLAKKCKAKIDENNIWINNNTFKTILMNNNKTIYNLLKDLLSQLRGLRQTDLQDQANITLINSYIRNLKANRVETVKDKLFEKVKYSKCR
jgi:hypothetical protein